MCSIRETARQSGFTLVELAIVIAIIGLLLTGVFKGQSMIRGAEVTSVVSTYKDVASAVRAFKDRYHYLPGDFPLNKSQPEITGVSRLCLEDSRYAGNGDGRISMNANLNESACVPEQLIRAGFLGGDPSSQISSRFGPVRVVSKGESLVLATATGSFSSSVLHVVELIELPCEIAKETDAKLDDGKFGDGIVMASVADCVAGAKVGLAVALQ